LSHVASILIPLPHYGFDPTESSVPWKKIKEAGFKITFATPEGQTASADTRMVTGVDLPRLLRGSLMAEPEAVTSYQEMARSSEFLQPLSYDAVKQDDYDALLLVGGHDKGMRPYLESPPLQKTVASFFTENKVVGAICHGTLLAARSLSSNGKSVLWGRKTTGLTKKQEWIAYLLTCLWLDDYYRTYSMWMAEELISYLRAPEDYSAGPGFPIPLKRDSDADLSTGFTVRDQNYLSARWPGDAHRFANEFIQMVQEQSSKKP